MQVEYCTRASLVWLLMKPQERLTITDDNNENQNLGASVELKHVRVLGESRWRGSQAYVRESLLCSIKTVGMSGDGERGLHNLITNYDPTEKIMCQQTFWSMV